MLDLFANLFINLFIPTDAKSAIEYCIDPGT